MPAVDWARGAARWPNARPSGLGDDARPDPSRGPHSTHRREPARPAGRGGPRGGPGRRVDPARRAAYEAIAAVHRDDAYANLVLPRLLRENRIVGRDAAFATELTYGTLRSEGQLDAIIADAAGRPVDRIDPPARDALRLGAYQLLYTRVPAARRGLHHGRPGPAGRAGRGRVRQRGAAADRRARPRRLARRRSRRPTADDPVGHLAVVHAHPQWIVRAFAEALGGDLGPRPTAGRWPPTTTGRWCTCAPGRAGSTRPSSPAEVGGLVGAYSPYAVYLPEGAPGDIAAIAHGAGPRAGRGLAAGRLGAGRRARRRAATSAGSTCAPARAARPRCSARSPPQRGARVTAVEVAPHRARLVEQAVPGLPVDVVCADGRDVGVARGAAGGRLRPGARRRAVHRARLAAPPAGVALAAHSRPTCRR